MRVELICFILNEIRIGISSIIEFICKKFINLNKNSETEKENTEKNPIKMNAVRFISFLFEKVCKITRRKTLENISKYFYARSTATINLIICKIHTKVAPPASVYERIHETITAFYNMAHCSKNVIFV